MGKNGAFTKDNPARHKRDLTIAQQRLQGATYAELAKAHGISKARIHQILSDEEIRDIIETGTRQLISMVPLAIDNYQSFLTDKSDKTIKYKSSKDLLQAVGIQPSHAPATVINQILAVKNMTVLDPRVAQALGGALDSLLGDDAEIIEVETVEG